MRMINCALVEDNQNLTQAIAKKIEAIESLNLLFTAKNGAEAIDCLKQRLPEVILMDINMPIMDGIEATEIIKSTYPDIKILILTVFDDDESIFESIVAGASGYLLKDESPGELINAIEEVVDGGAPMSPTIANKTLSLIRLQAQKPTEIPDFELTKRELEILSLISLGKTYKKIADQLFISPKTVKKHVENIYNKLHVHNKVEAIQTAIKYNLLG